MNYRKFGSKISFFEFIQEEYHKASFNVLSFEDELNQLKNEITIDSLTKILESAPKLFDIFEQLFQLKRFTNTQYIHFCFDVQALNNYSEEKIISYCNKFVFKFENGIQNKLFQEIYLKLLKNKLEEISVFELKRTIPVYIEQCIKKRENLYNHINNSISSRLRIAKYLIENLNADEFLSVLDLKAYLKLKRIPKDTKGLHGKFGIYKVSEKFKELGLKDLTSLVQTKNLPLDKSVIEPNINTKFCYVREKYIEGITIRKKNKLKKFDFIILKYGIPFIAIETNFYSTSGTKIGINLDEYTDLNDDIKKVSNGKLLFSWITDGNFWLTKNGEELFENIKQNFFIFDYNILNYNMIKEFFSVLLKTDE